MEYADQLTDYLKTGDKRAEEYKCKLKFLTMYDDLLCRWDLEPYQEDEEDYTANCLKPSEMQCLAQFSNAILGYSFCVDFFES